MAGVEVTRAYVGVAGADIRGINSQGAVSVARKDREITRHDIDRAIALARSGLPPDREVLHVIRPEFSVDDETGIADPLGMLGRRLEVRVHFVTAQVPRLKTLRSCVIRAGIEVAELVFEPLAIAEAILTADERELGTLIVDIGAGTTGVAVLLNGELHHSAVLPVGAGHFTNDLSMVLRTPFAEAERLKIKHGFCLARIGAEEEGLSIPAVGGGAARVVPITQMCEVLGPRAEELFSLIRHEVARSALYDRLRGGVVLTGGGAQLDGLLDVARRTLNCNARSGLPQTLRGLNEVVQSPIWVTSCGLLCHGVRAERVRKQSRQRSWGGVVRSLRGALFGASLKGAR
jgi:cell division protein FtsA